jgi:hypothetical protein
MRPRRVAAALGFARRIAGRHARAGARRRGLVLVLRRIPRPLRSPAPHRAAASGTRVFAVRLGPFHLHHPAGLAIRTHYAASPAAAARPGERVLTRIASRELVFRSRAGSGPSPRAAAGEPQLSVPERVLRAAPVPRVLRKPVGLAPSSEESGALAAPRAKPREAPPPLALAPAEVERLTSHVLHTLDRRLGAFRERRGKA